MNPTKQSPLKSSYHGNRHPNADLLREAGGDFEMAFYKAKDQVQVLSATVEQLTNERARLLQDSEMYNKNKVSSKYEEMERENSIQGLKQKYDELLVELQKSKTENKTL
jgi:hypothetical protein